MQDLNRLQALFDEAVELEARAAFIERAAPFRETDAPAAGGSEAIAGAAGARSDDAAPPGAAPRP